MLLKHPKIDLTRLESNAHKKQAFGSTANIDFPKYWVVDSTTRVDYIKY